MTSTILDIQRVLTLLRVVLKYGAKPLLRRIFLAPQLPHAGAGLRLALEELGLTYLKLGQFLALRFDILPAEVCRELNRLFEAVPPMSFEEVQTRVESELNAPLGVAFSVFNRVPIAAASVAQVHEAYTHGNEKVAVKVQRPGIERLFAADMRNLRRLAKLIDFIGIAGAFSAQEIADQFAGWTEREMDFIAEGRTAERLRKNAAPYEAVPQIHWGLTTKKVLTMEFIEGVSVARIADMMDAGRTEELAALLPNLDLSVTGGHIAFAVLRQLFVFGFFQGDPHPGNILIRADNTIAFVDFGIFGELTNQQRENLAGFFENIALGNIEQAFRYYAKQHTPTVDTDLKAFERDGKAILRRWYQTSVNPHTTPEERHMGRYAMQMIEAVRQHRLRTDPDTVLLWRALYALDASSERLSDYFDMMAQIRAFFLGFRPGPLERVAQMLADRNRTSSLFRLKREGPERVGRVLGDMPRGKLRLTAQADESKASGRASDWRSKSVTQGVVGISLATLAVAVPMSVPYRVVASVLAIIVFTLLAVQTKAP
ncbi:MAG: ABC1 kinase family protein [Pyrinomonadaceae bacterium]